MDRLIIKLFGLTRTNLLGWVVAGLLLIGVSLYLVWQSYQPFPRLQRSPEWYVLVAIAALLLGIFGVLLQMYCAQVAEKLDKDSREDDAIELDEE